MFDLTGKVAIITGGASGIGAAAVRMFAQLGASVTIGDIQVDAGEAIARELGDKVRFSRLDVRNPADWERTIEETETAFGPVSVLVNNAGHPGHWKSISDLSLEEYRMVCAINQDGAFLGMKLVLPSMMRAGGGSIVNNSSGYGLVGAAQNMDYCASKFALTGMTKSWAIELAPYGIRVVSIHPTGVNTPMNDGLARLEGLSPREIAERSAGNLLPVPWIEPEDVAAAVVFLASDKARFITGSSFVLDAGLLCK